jgi:hypothetical protein
MGAKKDARRELAVEHEKTMIAFRAGELPYFKAEQVTAKLCAEGDADRRQKAERAERARRELGARLRAGVI